MTGFSRFICVVLVLVAIWGLGAVAPAFAHTRSETHSAWQISGATVHLQFTVPDLEAKRVTPSGKDQPSSAQLGRYLADRVGVTKPVVYGLFASRTELLTTLLSREHEQALGQLLAILPVRVEQRIAAEPGDLVAQVLDFMVDAAHIAGLVAGVAMQTKYTAFVTPAVLLLNGLLGRRFGYSVLATAVALGPPV